MCKSHVSFEDGMQEAKKSGKAMDRVVVRAAKLEGIGRFDAAIVVVNQETIRELNKAYREVDMPTDVLSFPANALTGSISKADPSLLEHTGRRVFLGDVYICLEIAKAQAQEYGNTLKEELCFLTTHGMLHLMGYDHVILEDEVLMREKQRIILKRNEVAPGIREAGGQDGI